MCHNILESLREARSPIDGRCESKGWSDLLRINRLIHAVFVCYSPTHLRDAFVLRRGGLDPPSGASLFTRVVTAMWRTCGWFEPLISMNHDRFAMADALSKLCKRCASVSQHHRSSQLITMAHRWQVRIEMKVGSSASVQLVVMHAVVIR